MTWIGIVHEVQERSVVQTISKDRIAKIVGEIERVRAAKGLICSGLCSLAGELSWVAGVVPRLRPFVAELWAALHESQSSSRRGGQGAKRKPKDAVFVRQVDHALEWILRFCRQDGFALRREINIDHVGTVPASSIRTDASTT